MQKILRNAPENPPKRGWENPPNISSIKHLDTSCSYPLIMPSLSTDKQSGSCDKSSCNKSSCSCILLPGDAAPNFLVSAYSAGHIKTADLSKFKKNGRPVVILFYSGSFDLLLVSELAQLQAAGLRDQLPPGTVLMAASTDSLEVAQIWAEREVEKGGHKGTVLSRS